MKEDTIQNQVASSPHFSDRRVVQAAQPVVPLDEIRASVRNRRIRFLSAAFVIAMMLGAASALVAVRIKQMPETTAPANDTEPAETATTAEIPLESTAEAAPAIEEAPPVKHPAPVKKQTPAVAERPRIVTPRPGEVAPSEEEQLRQIREAVLYDQWQERRMRRAARRERRNRYGDRDLSHVDEIFEGTRRPDRPPY
ncbi:MAG TPA: hypothetical protein VFZ22_16965 [Pyrinomonadaceae bacterium]|nr:hypothetical protein [Pyrinomonadaceae bacterium]